MSHDTDAVCTCIGEHRPQPAELERHHLWPTYLGGPDEPANLIWRCPTSHMNCHEVLRLLCGQNGVLTAEQRARYRYEDRRVAQMGYDAWKASQ